MSYAFIDPEPAEGVFHCPRCMCDQTFETDPGCERDYDKPLYCSECTTRIDVAYDIEQIHPYPERRTSRPALSGAQREEGRLRLMRLRTAVPIAEPVPLPLDSDEGDLRAQLDQLGKGGRR